MKRLLQRSGVLLAGLTLFANLSPAYYYYTHYTTRTAPFTPVYEKFDVSALPNKTATFYISEPTNVQMATGDSFAALVSEIRAAAKVWNDVDTSDLRLAYGGIIAPSTQQSYPPIQIVFDDVPPGIVALGGPTVKSDFNGSLFPIVRSVLIIRPDFTKRPTYTYSEDFFGTLVHEFGHTLGLQHTFTSSAMSTGLTRAISKGKPLLADDIAAISNLYPAKSFGANTGSIAGRVTMGSSGVNVASVVAISPGGPVVSTLTNPDGTYQINGLPARQYYVYVHPLPPAVQGETTPGNVQLPWDVNGRQIAGSQAFNTVFYPGTRDLSQAVLLNVTAGSTNPAVNFIVTPRSAVQLHSVVTYGFPSSVYIKPPYINPNIPYLFLVASGNGLVVNSQPAPGLSVSVLSGAGLNIKPYSPAPDSYAEIDLDLRSFAFTTDSPRHLVFSANNDLYVLPNAYFQVQNQPPNITGVSRNSDGSLAVFGTNLSADTRVLLDGLTAINRSYDDGTGKLTVTPPPAPVGYKGAIVAVNGDGQSSLFLQGDNVTRYSYDTADGVTAFAAMAPSSTFVAATPGALNAGTETLVQIDSNTPAFLDGQTVVGFGSADIQVKRVWVASPTRLYVNIAVSASATPGVGLLSITTGAQLISQPFAVQILGSTRLASISANMTAQPNLSAGATVTATLLSNPAALSSSGATLNLNDQPIPVIAVNGNQITFQIPAGTPLGLATLRLDINGERGLPIGLQIDNPSAQSSAASPAPNPDSYHPSH